MERLSAFWGTVKTIARDKHLRRRLLMLSAAAAATPTMLYYLLKKEGHVLVDGQLERPEREALKSPPSVYHGYLGVKPEEVPFKTELDTKRKAMEIGTELLQSFGPINKFRTHLCGFHFYNYRDPSDPRVPQLEVQHYCSELNNEIMQCILFDGNTEAAKVIGVEYIITKRLFDALPESEQKMWHSLAYEVKRGLLVAPNVPQPLQNMLMKDLANRYGKAVHLWQVGRGDQLPAGTPILGMTFTSDGQIDPALVEKRDKREGISSEKIRENREKVIKLDREWNDPRGEPDPRADAWSRDEVAEFRTYVSKWGNDPPNLK